MNELLERLEVAVSVVDSEDLETLAELACVLEDIMSAAVDHDEQMVANLFYDAVQHSGLECSCASCMQWRVPDLRQFLLSFPENACSGDIEDLANSYVVYVLAWAKEEGIHFREILEAAKENPAFSWRVKAEIQETLKFLAQYKEIPSEADAKYGLSKAIQTAGLKAKNPYLYNLIRLFSSFLHKMGAV